MVSKAPCEDDLIPVTVPVRRELFDKLTAKSKESGISVRALCALGIRFWFEIRSEENWEVPDA